MHSPVLKQGSLDAKGLRFAVVASRFNHTFVEKLAQAAVDTVVRHGALAEEQSLVWVPGALEIPVVALRLAQTKTYHGVICVGAVIKGATDHYDFVVRSLEQGLVQASLQTGVVITSGVMTVATIEQAIERSGGSCGNLGYNAAMAAIEVANLMKQIG